MAWLRVILGPWLFEWLLIRMYLVSERIYRRADEPTWQGRAGRIRNVSRTFERAFGENFGFPVILNEAQTCQICNQGTFVVVHPDTICDRCWLEQVTIFQQAARQSSLKQLT
jgi:hypothetical protein